MFSDFLFVKGTTSSSSIETPEAIDHVGIICFNRLYEYGHSGIKKSNVRNSCKYTNVNKINLVEC